MLMIADFVRPTRREMCLRDRAFIENAGGLSYCVVPEHVSCPPDRLLVARYRAEPFGQLAYATDLDLPVGHGSMTLHSALTDVTYLLSFLADQPAWLERLRAADPHADDEAVVRSFGIDPDATCRPSVGGWAEGSFLAPDAGGYAHFYVDIRGEVIVQSRSASVLPVAFHLAAVREAERAGLSGRLGKTPPAPDDMRA